MSEPLLTTPELAEKLRVNRNTIVIWAKNGQIPSVRLGSKTLRYDLAEVLAALKANSAKATS
jgi:excisionase family DNA binding protein